ncbi:putative eka-like protein [Erysiphe necator]|uniref:Putative eka-like protein n=1 Tax=Uncinula necator TaxID=52586 RepID=A0A0B1P3I5_UNCNE|nr:putative eka-like protein [Erysiphe necator]
MPYPCRYIGYHNTYLRSAISEFAKVDTTPDIPKFFPAEIIHKSSSPSIAKLPKIPPAMASPFKYLTGKIKFRTIQPSDALPSITQNTENYWASAVRNGHKKSRTTKNSITCPKDKRLFLRLTNDNEWRKLSPPGIREMVVKKLSISPVSIDLIKPVRIGFALSIYKDKTRQELLKAAIRLSPFDAKLETASNWTPVLVPTTLKTINTLDGKIEVTKDMLANEIERVSVPTKVQIKIFRQAGDREYQAIVPAKIAEERAATIESDMGIATNSHSETTVTENSQALSVESSTEDA